MNLKKKINFTHKGIKCEIVQIDFNHPLIPPYHNGYVVLEPGHPWFGKDYDTLMNMGVEAHGGLTYAEPEPDGAWKIGFDTNHYSDTWITKSEDYVQTMTLKLAEQAYDAVKGKN